MLWHKSAGRRAAQGREVEPVAAEEEEALKVSLCHVQASKKAGECTSMPSCFGVESTTATEGFFVHLYYLQGAMLTSTLFPYRVWPLSNRLVCTKNAVHLNYISLEFVSALSD